MRFSRYPLLMTGGLLISLLLSGCLDTKPKVRSAAKPSFTGNDTANAETFIFNFAYRESTSRLVYLQASANTNSTMVATCNASGSGCECDFLNSSEGTITSVTASYDSTGNYFRCTYPSGQALADLAKVKLRTLTGSKSSDILTVNTSLTAEKIIGSELSMNRLRRVYQYKCLFNFLQKNGTNQASFDCTSQPNLCGNLGTGDFCLLQVLIPYYLYTETYSTNFNEKIGDTLYPGSNGYVCNAQIKKYDCTTAQGSPTVKFGLYGEQTGIWQIGVQLNSGPEGTNSLYGYAAKTSTYNGSDVCPPGLEKRTFYVATPNASSILPSHNFPTAGELLANEVVNPDNTGLTTFEINRLQNGDCNGTTCTPPSTNDSSNPVGTATYSLLPGATTFCVIPSGLL